MSFVKSRLGVIICLFVWVLIALVPLWRLRAIRQWRSSVVGMAEINITGHSDLGLTPAQAQEVARRFPNDMEAQLAPFERLALAPVYDVQVPTSQEEKIQQEKAALYFARYNELEKRFPQSQAVRMQHLRDTTRGHLIDEDALSIGVDNWNPGTQARHSVWLARPELENALATAREGARRDPNNGFFPWMEAVLQFSLNRPDAAIQALDRAGRCSGWDDGTFSTIGSHIALRSRVAPVGWEDEWFEQWGLLLPHMATMRSAARATSKQMRLARKRGEEARVLQIAGIVQQAAAVMARSNDTLIARLVGEAVCAIGWNAATENIPGKKNFNELTGLERSKALRRQSLARFVAYARAHGQSDLAEEAKKIAPTLNAYTVSAAFNSPEAKAVVAPLPALAGAYWLGAILLRLALVGVLVWTVALAVTKRAPATNNKRGTTLLWGFFCAGATATLLIVAVRLGAGQQLIDNLLGTYAISLTRGPSSPQDAPLWGYGLVLVGWCLPPVLVAFFRARQPKNHLERPVEGIRWKRLLEFGAWCVPGIILWFVQTMSDPDTFSAPIVAFYLVLTLASARFVTIATRNQKAERILAFAALWLGVLAYLLAGPSETDITYTQTVTCLAVISAVVALFLATRNSRNALIGEIAHAIRLMAGVLALSTTLGYALVTLWTIPVENTQHRNIERELRIGETNWLRERLAALRNG